MLTKTTPPVEGAKDITNEKLLLETQKSTVITTTTPLFEVTEEVNKSTNVSEDDTEITESMAEAKTDSMEETKEEDQYLTDEEKKTW